MNLRILAFALLGFAASLHLPPATAAPDSPRNLVLARESFEIYGAALVATPRGWGVNLRRAPSAQAPKVTAAPVLPVGTLAWVLVLGQDWAQVELSNGVLGWVRWHQGSTLYLVPASPTLVRRGIPPLLPLSSGSFPESLPPALPRARPRSPSPTPVPAVTLVHVTRTGSKYHRAGCVYLSRSDIPLERSAALRAGYTPCSVCGGG